MLGERHPSLAPRPDPALQAVSLSVTRIKWSRSFTPHQTFENTHEGPGLILFLEGRTVKAGLSLVGHEMTDRAQAPGALLSKPKFFVNEMVCKSQACTVNMEPPPLSLL